MMVRLQGALLKALRGHVRRALQINAYGIGDILAFADFGLQCLPERGNDVDILLFMTAANQSGTKI